jgi:hypothetical protein
VPPAATPPVVDEKRAEALFNAAKTLEAAGQVAEACPLFAQSKSLAPGIGVTLHLGNCYERTGRPASAWAQYREAETLARQKGDDKRADLAHERAHSLEGKVGRLTLAAAAGPHDGWQVELDGNAVPPAMWNNAVAVDPVDHTVTISAPGQPPRTLKAHFDASTLAATVSVDDGAGAAGLAGAGAAGESASVDPGAAASTSSAVSSPIRTRTWVEIALGGVGVVGLGLGAAFLIRKNQTMTNGCNGQMEDKRAAVASEVSFAVGGAAIASAIILYLTTPGAQAQVGTTIAPVLASGGAGAVMRGSF